jgi:Tol biopolymer transport system component
MAILLVLLATTALLLVWLCRPRTGGNSLSLASAAAAALIYLSWGLTEVARSSSSTAVLGLVMVPFVAAFFGACGFVLGKTAEGALFHLNKPILVRRQHLFPLLGGSALFGAWLGWMCWSCGGPDGPFYGSRPSFSNQTGDLVMSIRAGGEGHIYRFAPSGRGKLLTQSGDAFDPHVSRDGRFIVFALRKAADKSEIWMMNIDGSQPRRLTAGDYYDASPVLRAAGASVVFARATRLSSTGKVTNWDLYEAHIASGLLKQLSTIGFLRLATVDLTPDDQRAVVSAEERGVRHGDYPPPRLYVVDLSSGGQSVIGMEGDLGASVSSRHGQITFSRHDGTDNNAGQYNYEVFVMSADGRERRQVTHLSSYTHAPTMSPDQSRVVFLSDPARNQRFGLWEARLDNGHAQPVNLEYAEP